MSCQGALGWNMSVYLIIQLFIKENKHKEKKEHPRHGSKMLIMTLQVQFPFHKLTIRTVQIDLHVLCPPKTLIH